jgi:hypothetical protein
VVGTWEWSAAVLCGGEYLDDIAPRNRPEKEKHIGRQGYSITNIFYF